MTDAVATLAARERWLAVGRRLFTPGTVVIALITAVIFFSALQRSAGLWWLLLSGTCPVLISLLAGGWLTGLWWVPRAVRGRLAHLPHRQVTIAFRAEGLVFQSATERLELAWSELLGIRQLPHFWVFELRAGAAVPLPRSLMTAEIEAALRAAVPPAVFASGAV
jgi:hypothetical protein